VQTYKSLIGYVSTTLLSRLITKKIWTSPQLWMGFIHCVKAIAPASFGALMQLPREQLKELIDKQPSIKPALYQYVVQKAGVAKAQSLADVSVERFGSLQPFES
jgi:symplekin